MKKMENSNKPTRIQFFYWVLENSIKDIELHKTGEVQYIDGKKFIQVQGTRMMY